MWFRALVPTVSAAFNRVLPPVRFDTLKRLKAVFIGHFAQSVADAPNLLQFVRQFRHKVQVLGQDGIVRDLVTVEPALHEIEYDATYSLASLVQSILRRRAGYHEPSPYPLKYSDDPPITARKFFRAR